MPFYLDQPPMAARAFLLGREAPVPLVSPGKIADDLFRSPKGKNPIPKRGELLKNLNFIQSAIKMPLMELPVQSVVVSTSKGKILISPGSRLTDEQLQSLGTITDIVAPNLLHCGGMRRAIKIHPQAKKWGAPGARLSKNEIPWDEELTPTSWAYQSELPILLLQGMPQMNEVVFLHKESRSLIVTDFCFNLTKVQGFGAWLILSFFGTYKKFAVSRLFLKYVKDSAQFKNSVAEVLRLDFENIVLSHGENLIGSAKPQLVASLKERGISFT